MEPRCFQDDGSKMDPSVIQDGSRMEPRWFQDDGSKMDPSVIQEGSRMEPESFRLESVGPEPTNQILMLKTFGIEPKVEFPA